MTDRLERGAYGHVDMDTMMIIDVEDVVASVAFEHDKKMGDNILGAQLNETPSFCLTFTGKYRDGQRSEPQERTGNIFFDNPEIALNCLQALVQMFLDERGLARMGDVFSEELLRVVTTNADPYVVASFVQARLAALEEELDVPEDH